VKRNPKTPPVFLAADGRATRRRCRRPSKPKPLPVFLGADEPEAILRATTTRRDRVLLMTALYMGLRVGELCSLQVPRLDFAGAQLWVREGKGQKDRCLPIPRKLLGPLRGWVGTRTEGYVFPSRQGGGRMTERAVQLLVKRLAVKAGLRAATEPRRCTPHKFRHAFASRMLDRGSDIVAVRDALGHASVATTQIYTHVSNERLRAEMEV
jgi:integrase/recombinase XerD